MFPYIMGLRKRERRFMGLIKSIKLSVGGGGGSMIGSCRIEIVIEMLIVERLIEYILCSRYL